MDVGQTPPVPFRCRAGRGRPPARSFFPGDREHAVLVDAPGGAACPPRPDHSQGYVWAIHPSYDIFRAAARRLEPAPADRRARLRRRGDGMRQGRLDRLHVGARRRPRALPDGRRRQATQKRLTHTSATTAAPSSAPTAPRSSGARAPGAHGRRGSGRTSGCLASTWCARPSSSSGWRTPTAADARADHLPRRGVVRAARSSRRGGGSSSRRTTATRRGASSICGRSTSTAPTSSGSPREPGFDGFPMFSPDGNSRCAFLVRTREPTAARARTTPTCSSRAGWTNVGARRRSRAGRPDRRRHRVAGRSGAAGTRRRHRRGWPPRAPTSRGA